jgi:Ca2+-binding EF-hand superfamily protein
LVDSDCNFNRCTFGTCASFPTKAPTKNPTPNTKEAQQSYNDGSSVSEPTDVDVAAPAAAASGLGFVFEIGLGVCLLGLGLCLVVKTLKGRKVEQPLQEDGPILFNGDVQDFIAERLKAHAAELKKAHAAELKATKEVQGSNAASALASAVKAKEEEYESALAAKEAEHIAVTKDWDAKLEEKIIEIASSSLCMQCQSPVRAPEKASIPPPMNKVQIVGLAKAANLKDVSSPSPDSVVGVSDFFAMNVVEQAPQTPPRTPPPPSTAPPPIAPATPISKFLSVLGKGAESMRLLDLFRAMDIDQNKEIDRQELSEGIKRLGRSKGGRKMVLSERDIDEVMAALDKNGDGKLSVQEWKEGLSHRLSEHRHNKIKKKEIAKARLGQGGKKQHHDLEHKIRIDAAARQLCDAIRENPLELRSVDVFKACSAVPSGDEATHDRTHMSKGEMEAGLRRCGVGAHGLITDADMLEITTVFDENGDDRISIKGAHVVWCESAHISTHMSFVVCLLRPLRLRRMSRAYSTDCRFHSSD